VDFQEIQDEWCREDGINVHLTIDRAQPEWDGHVGFVPDYVKELGFDTDKTVVMCGPPIMIKFTLAGLMELGFDKKQVYTTMELKMKCGVGKCGRCNIGQVRLQGRPGFSASTSSTSCRMSINWRKSDGKNGECFPVRQKI
jgi:NAD(P)H-flavin reductase